MAVKLQSRHSVAVFMGISSFICLDLSAMAQVWKTYPEKHLTKDIPLLGDVDGDGRDDLVIYRPANGRWYAASTRELANPASRSQKRPPENQRILNGVSWGDQRGDVPLLGDLDGDRVDDLIIFRPGEGPWYGLRPEKGKRGVTSLNKETRRHRFRAHTIRGDKMQTDLASQQWGKSGDIPLLGDIDGDGRLDLVTWRDEGFGGRFFTRLATGYRLTPRLNGCIENHRERKYDCAGLVWGNPGDKPMLADVDGDGKDDFLTWRPGGATQGFHATSYTTTTLRGGIKRAERAPMFNDALFGASQDLPLTFERASSRVDRLGVWRPSGGRPIIGSWASITRRTSAQSRPEHRKHGASAGAMPVIFRCRETLTGTAMMILLSIVRLQRNGLPWTGAATFCSARSNMEIRPRRRRRLLHRQNVPLPARQALARSQ